MTGESVRPEQASARGTETRQSARESERGALDVGGAENASEARTGPPDDVAPPLNLPRDVVDRYATAIRAAAHDCDGNCGASERECHEAHPIQVAAYHFDAIATVYGTPEALAAAVARQDRLHIAFGVARELGRQVPELPELRERAARLEEELVDARATVARVREAAPMIRRALEKLPAKCRYHDDTAPHGDWREACCDTGITPRRRELAEQALDVLVGLPAVDETPAEAARDDRAYWERRFERGGDA